MRCPIDNETLVIAERAGIEIDYCPKCRGVWLDRGELDKIIERADRPARDQGPQRTGPREFDERAHPRREDRRRESILGELFDFF